MNILYIVGGEGNRYGSEIIAIDLIAAGRRNGINYIVITANRGAVSKVCDELGIENYVIPFTFFVYRAMRNKAFDLIKKTVWRCRAEYLTNKAIKFIERTVDLKSINLIHTNLTRDLIGGRLAEKYCLPHIWHIHELYQAHYHLSFLRPKQLEWMAGHAINFIAISDTVAKDWIQHGLPQEKVVTVYNGIDLPHLLVKDNYGCDRHLKLVMVGRVCPAKGQDIVIKKLAKLPERIRKYVIFDCFGESKEDYKRYLVKIASDSGVSISLKGYCSEIGNELRNYDIGVNCSRGEGFGLSIVEYMAAGICPVVSNTGANEEIVKNGINGFVFDYLSETNLAERIEYLYKHRKEMIFVSKRAREEAVLRYSLEKMQQKIFTLYKEKTTQ